MKTIKQGKSKCVIEAHFDISRYCMEGFFKQNDIDYDPTDCILRREISPSGKSRAFINDTPVPIGIIRNLGEQLVDIHSQHQNLLLNEEDFQLNVIDIIAKDSEALQEYKKLFDEYNKAKKSVSQLREKIEESKTNEDFLRFQQKEISDAGLKEGMQEELEQESEKLSHVEEIKSALYTADSALNSNDNEEGSLHKIKEASRALESISSIYPETKELSARLESCYIELKDISQEISSETDNIEFDPQRLEQVNTTLDKIYSLEQKYHVASVKEILDFLKDVEDKLDKIDNSDEELGQLEETERECLRKCKEAAMRLTEIRKKAAGKIEKEMRERLVPLGIPNVRFAVLINEKDLCNDGHDRISFLFSANTSSPLQPVSQVASGGEIARVMLSLKAMISGAVKLPTIIFDEIDTGVSGKIAEKMAGIMQEMAENKRQVISITHLPQIAAKGSTHYKVYKEETENGTTSRMQILDKEERIKEIAQMLSGSEISDAAVNNARELLK